MTRQPRWYIQPPMSPRSRRQFATAVALAVSVGLCACGARTGVSVRPLGTSILACTTVPYLTQPGVAVRVYAAVPDGSNASTVWTVSASPAGSHPVLQGTQPDSVVFTSDVAGNYDVEITATDGTDAPVRCIVHVAVRAFGPAAVCPPDVTTTPGTVVTLTGIAGGDPSVSSLSWRLSDAPAVSGRPAPEPTDSATTHFVPDVVGDFTLEWRVTGGDGLRDACSVIVHSVVTDGLRVELSWDPPGRACPGQPGAACDSSDVDLHLLRTSGGSFWGSQDDCYWYNCDVETMRRLTWPGPPGASPRLDHDIVAGHGPESLTVHTPVENSYRIGVHYFDNHGAEDESATVLVYCTASVPVATLGPVTLHSHGSQTANDFWMAADVFPLAGGGCRVQPIMVDGQSYVVTYAIAMSNAGPPP